jgi:hypothetical protein
MVTEYSLVCVDCLGSRSRLERGFSKDNIDVDVGISESGSRAILIAGGWGMGLVRRYIRILVVTFTGLLHHRKYIIPLRKAKATVTSSISVIVRP